MGALYYPSARNRGTGPMACNNIEGHTVMKLPSQKYRTAVATAINSVMVWRKLWHEAESNTKENAVAARAYYNAVLDLYETYGIELPALEDAQERIDYYDAEVEHYRSEEAQAQAVPSDYTCIALWGEELGSYAYYIEAEQARACAEGAPLNAIFKHDGEWRTLDQMQNRALKAKLEAQLAVA